MKLVVLSGSGNVGKTVVAEHLLAPRMDDALLLRFGGLQNFGKQGHWRQRSEISDVFAELLEQEHCIVDVAGHASAIVLAGIHRFASIHHAIDYFVIPVTSSGKVQFETIALLDRLNAVGVDANQIRIVFNRVDSSVEEEFGTLLNYINQQGVVIGDRKAAIYETELSDILIEKNLTIRQVMDDETDYKRLLRENKQEEAEQREDWADRYAIKCLTKHVKRHLDSCYETLFAKP